MRLTYSPEFFPGPLCAATVKRAIKAPGDYSALLWLELARLRFMRKQLAFDLCVKQTARDLDLPRTSCQRALDGLAAAGLLKLGPKRRGKWPKVRLLVDPLHKDQREKPAAAANTVPLRRVNGKGAGWSG